MTWNTDMSTAPKGKTEKVTMTHHRNGKTFTKDITVKVPLLLSVSVQVIKSFWSESREQWSGVATDETPDAWMPWPEPYEVKS
ncbi:MAG: hypothetical protein AAFR73_12370 [Pseudomonadota bacterium]